MPSCAVVLAGYASIMQTWTQPIHLVLKFINADAVRYHFWSQRASLHRPWTSSSKHDSEIFWDTCVQQPQSFIDIPSWRSEYMTVGAFPGTRSQGLQPRMHQTKLWNCRFLTHLLTNGWWSIHSPNHPVLLQQNIWTCTWMSNSPNASNDSSIHLWD